MTNSLVEMVRLPALIAAFVLQFVSMGGNPPAPLAPQAHIPFAAGETATYRAAWGIFGRAGGATLTVRRDTLEGDTVLHAVLLVRGGIPGARITERLESWMNASTVASHRFVQHTRYPGFARDRRREFDAANRRWTGHTNTVADSGKLPTARPLDDLSAVFVARTLQLTVGKEVVLHDYWRPESNPIVLKVLRRETIKVPAGTYNTIVVRPIIRTSSLFAEDGEAEVYLSEGPQRELVMLKAKLKVGTLVLRLERFTSTQVSQGNSMTLIPFSDQAKQLLDMARQEAIRLNHEYVGTEHVLLALASEAAPGSSFQLRNLSVDPAGLRREVEAIIPAGKNTHARSIDLPKTSRTVNALAMARQAAVDAGRAEIGVEHVVLGLLRERMNIAAQVLLKHGVTEVAVAGEIERLRQPDG